MVRALNAARARLSTDEIADAERAARSWKPPPL
jgi:hypothetical protein